jgi:membrane protease YdiL (CAAX protease family)
MALHDADKESRPMENRKFPTAAMLCLLIFMAAAWVLQAAAALSSGGFALSGLSLAPAQSILLLAAMLAPAAVLLIFCALGKIPLRSLGLRPIKPLHWLAAFGLVALLQCATLLSVIGFSDYPSFSAADGEWGIKGVATILGYPNPPAIFALNTLLSMALATVVTIPQALGEELAWRGYLQKVFADRFGMARGIVFLGIAWGVFHAPANLAGYNFNGVPVWLGAFVFMPISCIALGAVFGCLRAKSGSVWPAAVAHAAYNVFAVLVELAIPKTDPTVFYGVGIAIQLVFGAICLRMLIPKV